MRIAFLYSAQDVAGANLARAIRSLVDSTTQWPATPFLCELAWSLGSVDAALLRAEDDVIDLEEADLARCGADEIVFLSRHSSRSGERCVCVHAIGNFGTAQLGGRDGMLVPVRPARLTQITRALVGNEERLETYRVSLEATHHGPYTRIPSVFLEIGSDMESWKDEGIADVIAKIVVETLQRPIEAREACFGIGGNHYCASFMPLIERFDFAGACANFNCGDLSEEHIEQIRTFADTFVVDDRNLGRHKRHVHEVLEQTKAPYVRVRDLRISHP